MITKKQVIALLIVLFVPLMSYSVTNDEIANKALEYNGVTFSTWQQGQCKTFVQNVVRWAGGPEIGAGYKECYEIAGREINSSEAVRGDIIQVSSDTKPETDDSKVHTAIVLQNYGSGNYQVVDSNFVPPYGLTVAIHDWNPLAKASAGFSPHFYRVGVVPIGLYPNGTTNQAILTRYNQSAQEGHPLGDPINNNFNAPQEGTEYVHNWNGVILQDFYGENTRFYHGYTSIILNPEGTQAHLLKEGFWDCYTSNDGSVEYGAPFTEEITARYANSPFIQIGDYVQADNEIVVQKFQRVGTTDFTGKRTLVYNKARGGDARRFPVGEFSIGSDRSEDGVQWYVTVDDNPANDKPWPKAGVLTPTGRWFTKAIKDGQRYNFVCHDSYGNRRWGEGFTAAITEGNSQWAEPGG
ncbi:MAG: hypothetical protein WC323_01005, partial [Patescibacteria group bacterium]